MVAASSAVADAPAKSPSFDARQADIALNGGGPGGSAATAALLAAKAWRVLLIGKARHPRFHSGEFLLPLNLPVFEQLGCARAIESVGGAKHSVQFHWKCAYEAIRNRRSAVRRQTIHATDGSG